MKKISKAILFGLAFLSVGAITACNENKVDETTQVAETAIEKILLPQNGETVSNNFDVVNTVKHNGETISITWTSDKEVITFKTTDGKTKAVVDYFSNTTAAQEVTLTATIKVGDKSASKKFVVIVPKFNGIKTIAEADAAKAKDTLTLKGVIVAKEAYNASGKKTNVYLMCDGGGFEAYNLTCASQDKYDSELAVGNTIYVTGPKSYYNGLRELSGCTYIYDENTPKQEVTAENLTDKIGAITEAYQCHLAKLENVEILSIGTPDASGQYSITVANPDDSTKETVVRVSKYFFTGKTATDYAFKDLNLVVGQKITVTGFVGWYNGAQVTPIAADDIVAGQIDYAKVLGLTLVNKLSLPAKVYGAKTFVLPSTLTEAELSGDEYAGLTVEWTKTSEHVTLGTKHFEATPEEPATDTKAAVPGVPAYDTTTVTTVKVDADEDVVLTLNVKNAEGEVVFTKNVTLKLVSTYIPDTHADVVAAEKDTEVTVEGVVSYVYKSTKDGKNLATFALVDAEGGSYLVYNLTLNEGDSEKIVLGKKVAVSGKIDLFNKLIEVASPSLLNSVDGTAVQATEITELPTVTAETQSKLVTFTGVVKTKGRAFVITVGTGDAAKDIDCYVISSEYTNHPEMVPVAGSKVTVTGLLAVNNDASRVNVYQPADIVDTTTEAEKVDLAIKAIQAQFSSETYKQTAEVTLTKIFGDAETVTITSTDGNDVALDKDALKVTITPTSTEQTYELKFTVTIGEVTSEEQTVTIKSQTSTSGLKAELKQNVTAETAASTLDAAGLLKSLSLDKDSLKISNDIFTISYDKNEATDMKIRTDGIRMYATRATTKGNKLRVTIASGYVIDKIEISFDSAAYGQYAVVYAADGVTKVTGTDGTYLINGNSFTIYDDNSSIAADDQNAQVRFGKITITYSMVAA